MIESRWVLLLRSHKSILLVSVLLIASFAMSVYFAFLPPRTGPQVSITSFPVELSFGLDKTEYVSGENVTIEFYVRNISNATLRMIKGYRWPNDPSVVSTESLGASTQRTERNVVAHYFHFGLALAYGNGTEILRTVHGIFPTVYDILLERNGYIRQTVKFGRQWGITPLPTGTYKLKAIFIAGLNKTSSITLETQWVCFRIK